MSASRLAEFLEREQVKYTIIPHQSAYTAQDTARVSQVPARELAKTVVVKVDGKLIMAVVPAHLRVDLSLVQAAMGAREADLAAEREFECMFPGCEVGAMPPIGTLYGMDVLVDEGLTDNEEIAFNGGSHAVLVRIGYHDFERLVRPTVARFAVERGEAQPGWRKYREPETEESGGPFVTEKDFERFDVLLQRLDGQIAKTMQELDRLEARRLTDVYTVIPVLVEEGKGFSVLRDTGEERRLLSEKLRQLQQFRRSLSRV